MDNKRAFPRFSLNEPVSYERPAGSQPIGSLSGNISLGGIKLTAYEFIPIGTILRMQINFSNPMRSVTVQGKVLWVKEISYGERYEIGVEFVRDVEAVQAISSVLNARRLEPV